MNGRRFELATLSREDRDTADQWRGRYREDIPTVDPMPRWVRWLNGDGPIAVAALIVGIVAFLGASIAQTIAALFVS